MSLLLCLKQHKKIKVCLQREFIPTGKGRYPNTLRTEAELAEISTNSCQTNRSRPDYFLWMHSAHPSEDGCGSNIDASGGREGWSM